MPAIVREGRVADQPLSRRADRGHTKRRAKARAKVRGRRLARLAGVLSRGLYANSAVVQDHDRQLGGAADDDDGVATGALARHGKSAAGERIVDPTGERALADHGELG